MAARGVTRNRQLQEVPYRIGGNKHEKRLTNGIVSVRYGQELAVFCPNTMCLASGVDIPTSIDASVPLFLFLRRRNFHSWGSCGAPALQLCSPMVGKAL